MTGERHRKIPIRTGLGVELIKWLKSSSKRVNPWEKCTAPFQAQRLQQEDIIKEIKKHSFYMKPGEKAPGQKESAFRRKRTGARSSGRESGLRIGRPPTRSGSLFRFSLAARRRTSENQAPVRQNVWVRVSASCPAGPRDPRPASPDTGLLKHLGSQVQSPPKLLPRHGTRGRAASWNITIEC